MADTPNAMYSERLCKPKIAKIVLTFLSGLIIVIAICHFAYSGLYGKLLDIYDEEELKDSK